MVSQPRRDPLSDPLLTPENCVLMLVDYQASRIDAVQSMDRDRLLSNVVALAETARHFQVPSLLTSVEMEVGEGRGSWAAIRQTLAHSSELRRTSLNAWEDADLLAQVKALGRRKLILGGLWTEACLALTALDALRDGYEVLVPVDAVGGTSVEAHHAGLARMFQLGVQPVSCVGVLFELQRDWSRAETVRGTVSIARQQAGAWPLDADSDRHAEKPPHERS